MGTKNLEFFLQAGIRTCNFCVFLKHAVKCVIPPDHGLDVHDAGLCCLLPCQLPAAWTRRVLIEKVKASLLHGGIPDDGGSPDGQHPANVRLAVKRQTKQAEENVPELFIFPAVDDNVDGGVEDEEEV